MTESVLVTIDVALQIFRLGGLSRGGGPSLGASTADLIPGGPFWLLFWDRFLASFFVAKKGPNVAYF